MARLCYVNVNTEEASGPFLSIVERLFRKVARPDTEIVVKSVKPGLRRAFDLGYSYFSFLNKREIVEKIIEGEKEGYDAAMVGCFLDPGVEEARAIVNIPVIGLGESAMHFACLFGHRFAIVTANDPKLVSEMEIELRLYGLEAQTISNPVRRISLSEAEVFKSLTEDPRIVASDVLERAKKCVEDGAEVVVVGCNLLGPLCALSDLAEVEEMHVPILDCTSVAIKMAETIVDFKNRLGVPPISRAGIYRLPREKDIKRVRPIFGLKAD